MLPRLRFERHVAGLTQEELALRAGIRRESIVRLEAGQRPARPATIRRLADALGVGARRLMSGP